MKLFLNIKKLIEYKIRIMKLFYKNMTYHICLDLGDFITVETSNWKNKSLKIK